MIRHVQARAKNMCSELEHARSAETSNNFRGGAKIMQMATEIS